MREIRRWLFPPASLSVERWSRKLEVPSILVTSPHVAPPALLYRQVHQHSGAVSHAALQVPRTTTGVVFRRDNEHPCTGLHLDPLHIRDHPGDAHNSGVRARIHGARDLARNGDGAVLRRAPADDVIGEHIIAPPYLSQRRLHHLPRRLGNHTDAWRRARTACRGNKLDKNPRYRIFLERKHGGTDRAQSAAPMWRAPPRSSSRDRIPFREPKVPSQ